MGANRNLLRKRGSHGILGLVLSYFCEKSFIDPMLSTNLCIGCYRGDTKEIRVQTRFLPLRCRVEMV